MIRILLSLLLFVCGLSVSAQTAPDDDWLTAPVLPLNLAVTGQDNRGRARVVGPEGGSFKLRSNAGDRITLTIPPGALLTDTTITVTPIDQTAGLPDGAGPIVGVLMQPDGLQLARTATLEITPKVKIAPGDRLHWGFYGAGEDAFLHIPDLSTDKIVIPIDHFSGAGVSLADRINLQLDRWRQKSIEDRLSTQVAEIYRDIKKNGDPDGTKISAANDLMSGEATRRVFGGWRSIAANPAADCETLEEGTKSALGLERQRQLVGLGDNDQTTEVLRALHDRYWQVCFPKKVDQCLATGDLSALVRFALQFDKTVQIMNLAPEDSPAANHEPELREALVRCGRYKLTVTSSGRWEDSAGVYGTVDFRIEAPIRLTFSQPTGFAHYLEGEAGPSSQSLTFVDYACWKMERSRAGQPFLGRLTELTFNSQTSAPVSVILQMRAVELFAVISCTSKRGTKTLDHEAVHVTWGIGHKKERYGAVYTLKDMKPGSYPKLFSRDWSGQGSDNGTTANDSTTLVLEHIGK